MALNNEKKQSRAQSHEIFCRKTDPATPASCTILHLSEHLVKAAEELGAIVEVTASASDTIIDCAEVILEAETANQDDFAALVFDQATRILEACAFQDITGQRAKRLTERLQQMEARLARTSGSMNEAADVLAQDAEEAELEARRKRLILHGPQSAREAISQAKVDALLSAGKTARRAARRSR